MAVLDEDQIDHLDSGEPTKPIFLIMLDIDGDVIRATTTNYPITLPTLDDPDLSEQTFYPTYQVLRVGDIVNREDGSDTLDIELSGQILPDADLLAAIGDRAKWQGRPVKCWVIIRDQDRTQIGGIAEYHAGYMSAVGISPGADRQVIKLDAEGYRALLNQASNRSYLDQKRYDSSDTSAAATIGAANGARTGPGAALGYGGAGTAPSRQVSPGLAHLVNKS
ncbi:hypothetical protein GCM10023232_27310 [Sphingosinicella ginsenosidimutans]|uniref:Uncharacterized protein n=1 Tax=Allosphingosinicella ginsenosidimutans TaxID=1176539 RepID=A0A5C6TVE7_9SPHN|nr:hypothetical protein [Sphingosinicella ginsenosidimutans]TXC63668.1 hypothetical protein FRZ32_08355 [Sphingosinicella ginsenosidimutans]